MCAEIFVDFLKNVFIKTCLLIFLLLFDVIVLRNVVKVRRYEEWGEVLFNVINANAKSKTDTTWLSTTTVRTFTGDETCLISK